jgi:hypothetical protein
MIRHPQPKAQAAGMAGRDPRLLNERFQTRSGMCKTKIVQINSNRFIIFNKILKILKKTSYHP